MANNIRFGDFVRNQLRDKNSEISKATKRLKNWKTLMASNPRISIRYDGISLELIENVDMKGFAGRFKWRNTIEQGYLGWVGMLMNEKLVKSLDNKTKIIDT